MLRVHIQVGSHSVEPELRADGTLLIARSDLAGVLHEKAVPGGERTVEVGLRTLSQEHARVSVTADNRIFVEDLGSTNGTYLKLPANRPFEVPGHSELLLGRDLSLRLNPSPQGQGQFSEALSIRRPEDLVSYLRTRLGDRAQSIRLTRPGVESSGGESGITQARLPLSDRAQLVIDWRSQTYDIEADGWLRAIVGLFNSQHSSAEEEQRSWRFTAISDGRQRALWLAKRVAASSCTVLIRGATGCGKEVLANDLHAHSPRAARPFVAVNCGAIQASLAESVLFGHVKGSFTGATDARQGLFEQADGGTLFLDEIGELPLDLQVKLLRVIETRRVTPVGSARERPVDVRILAATHRPLEAMVAEKTFREDLFFRLSMIQVFIPKPEPADLEELARLLLLDSSEPRGAALASAELAAVARLAARHSWPGGVREMRNVLMRYLLLREPDRSVAENWAITMETGAPSAPRHFLPEPEARIPTATPSPPVEGGPLAIPEHAPLSIRKQLDNLLFLSVLLSAIERDPRVGISDIASRVDMTYQGVVNRLKALDLKFDGKDLTQRIHDRIAEERDFLKPYDGWLRTVLA
jgi:DNA-binding NtrC family response regulator